jgi:hypothetical protein
MLAARGLCVIAARHNNRQQQTATIRLPAQYISIFLIGYVPQTLLLQDFTVISLPSTCPQHRGFK